MYNPYGAPPAYGRPPGFPGFPGQPGTPPVMGGPPGMAPPPGMAAAPGTAPVPGMAPAAAPQAAGGRGIPPNFQPPPNMPNINFSAPVIRLGTTGPSKPATPLAGGPGRKESAADVAGMSGRPGLGAGGMEQQRQAVRESMMALVPPTKEELVRTVFVGGITEGVDGDEGIERILRSAGPLRKWTRATDADSKPCRFGFAEYDDIESLGVAVEILKDIIVPVNRQSPRTADQEQTPKEEIEQSKLLIIIDEESLNFLEEHLATNGQQDPSALQARFDNARETLSNVLNEFFYPTAPAQTNENAAVDGNGDSVMQNGETKPDGTQGEVVTIPLTMDDELADIPPELRETVAAEIAAFRDRSNRRDMERLKREEEMEAMERARGSRVNRLASPPPGAPSGPAGGANGIPVGPRDRGVHGAPLGPKGLQGGQQLGRDYQKNVSFVNGAGVNGAADAGWINREDEDSDASDEELERRREEKRQAELEKQYLDQERRWLNRERSRTAAVEREKARDKDEAAQQQVEKDAIAKRLREWNDDEEASRKAEAYYADRGTWIRNRAAFRTREAELDDRDRAAEERERIRDSEKREHARGMADQFLARQAEELEERNNNNNNNTNIQQTRPREPQRFKLSLGAAAQRAQQAAHPRRTVAEVEGLLEDEEEAGATTKRTLIPITFDSAAEAAGLTEEERTQAVRQLAADIPTTKDGLWSWPVKWEFVDESVLTEQLRPFVEKKIVEYLGVQEQMLVEVVEEHIRKRGGPQELVEQLEGPLDEEAEALVKKLWRMIIFFSESEKRGLST
ncbi:hypothetical protein L228DRAFT_258854 [Xylona heveae TC161]|uniref:PWI domain-containing protein n=1 Tax=Xylona heveae (strain CBS 132557 / TC161) TaxID=1328760 RepID=A0A165IUY3_XYLHT|nr:hypothetical protein L228DRAFT_258854 [Xylona heveae TC161]KZF25425.1 hypothetical protein L228DRAFT_258854 [Xylona heveae TC161]